MFGKTNIACFHSYEESKSKKKHTVAWLWKINSLGGKDSNGMTMREVHSLYRIYICRIHI
jgi:hypothetical protein